MADGMAQARNIVKDAIEAVGGAEGAGPGAPDLVLDGEAPFVNAKRFVARRHMAGDKRTLHHQGGTFYAWEGSHYAERPPEEMRQALYDFLHGGVYLDKVSCRYLPFNPNKPKVAYFAEAIAAEVQLPGRVRAPAWLGEGKRPAPGEVISCSNTLLHLPTRRMMPHTPDFFTVNALAFPYDADAPEPARWLEFLRSLWPGDEDSIENLQEMFGLCLTGETKYQKAFLLVGPPRSGKGTIARVLAELLGAANVCGPTLSSLGSNFGLAPLIGKRVALVSDARLSGKVDQQVIVERILSVTGEDSLTIDRKFREGWTGKLDARFVILTNELPRLTDSSGALASRFIILKMAQSFLGREKLNLLAGLLPELPGILKWAIEGWDRLTNRGYFDPPRSSEAAKQELQDLGSPIGAFLRERCEVGDMKEVLREVLYQAWCDWCKEQGREHPGNAASFGRDLASVVTNLGTVQHRDAGGRQQRFYAGVGLQDAVKTRRPVVKDDAASRDGDLYYADDPGPSL